MRSRPLYFARRPNGLRKQTTRYRIPTKPFSHNSLPASAFMTGGEIIPFPCQPVRAEGLGSNDRRERVVQAVRSEGNDYS